MTLFVYFIIQNVTQLILSYIIKALKAREITDFPGGVMLRKKAAEVNAFRGGECNIPQ